MPASSVVVLSLIGLLVGAALLLAALDLRRWARRAPPPLAGRPRLHTAPLPHISPPAYRLRRAGGGARHLTVV